MNLFGHAFQEALLALMKVLEDEDCRLVKIEWEKKLPTMEAKLGTCFGVEIWETKL